MASKPQRTGGRGRINGLFPPPGGLVAGTMQLAMVAATQRNRELVADLSSHRPALSKAKVVGVRRASSTDQAGLLGNCTNVVAVANSTGLWHCQHALIDRVTPRVSVEVAVSGRIWLYS